MGCCFLLTAIFLVIASEETQGFVFATSLSKHRDRLELRAEQTLIADMKIWLDGRNPLSHSLVDDYHDSSTGAPHARLQQADLLLLNEETKGSTSLDPNLDKEDNTTEIFVQRSGKDGNTMLINPNTPGDASVVTGAFVPVKGVADLDRAMALLGSVPWLLVEIADEGKCWKMIPVENLVAFARQAGTKLAVRVQNEEDVLGLARSLELGVDALCVSYNAPHSLWQAVLQAKKERNEQQRELHLEVPPFDEPKKQTEAEIISARCCKLSSRNEGPAISVLADRVCIDFVQLLQPTEGCWIGSSAKTMALVLSEASPSVFVPSRPFRVNAGPVHSYVLMSDGKTTKYLCELQAGDHVLVYNCRSNTSRSVPVGRLKMELRPCVVVGLESASAKASYKDDASDNGDGTAAKAVCYDAQVLLQQAETVRLGTQNGDSVSLADLPTRPRWSPKNINNVDGETITDSQNEGSICHKGDTLIMLRVTNRGTHVGQSYSGRVEET